MKQENISQTTENVDKQGEQNKQGELGSKGKTEEEKRKNQQINAWYLQALYREILRQIVEKSGITKEMLEGQLGKNDAFFYEGIIGDMDQKRYSKIKNGSLTFSQKIKAKNRTPDYLGRLLNGEALITECEELKKEKVNAKQVFDKGNSSNKKMEACQRALSNTIKMVNDEINNAIKIDGQKLPTLNINNSRFDSNLYKLIAWYIKAIRNKYYNKDNAVTEALEKISRLSVEDIENMDTRVFVEKFKKADKNMKLLRAWYTYQSAK